MDTSVRAAVRKVSLGNGVGVDTGLLWGLVNDSAGFVLWELSGDTVVWTEAVLPGKGDEASGNTVDGEAAGDKVDQDDAGLLRRVEDPSVDTVGWEL